MAAAPIARILKRSPKMLQNHANEERGKPRSPVCQKRAPRQRTPVVLYVWSPPLVDSANRCTPAQTTGFDDLDLGQFRVGVSELVVRAPSGGDLFCQPACPRIERSGCVCSSVPPGSSGLTAFGYKQHRAFRAEAPRPGGWFFSLPPGAGQRSRFTRQPRVHLRGRPHFESDRGELD